MKRSTWSIPRNHWLCACFRGNIKVNNKFSLKRRGLRNVKLYSCFCPKVFLYLKFLWWFIMQSFLYLLKGSLNLLIWKGLFLGRHENILGWFIFIPLSWRDIAIWILTLLTLRVAMISIKVIKDPTQIKLFSLSHRQRSAVHRSPFYPLSILYVLNF